jgi:EAL domain-containing protein (putative c-di-GMP-specific phosphodiesterase class I)
VQHAQGCLFGKPMPFDQVIRQAQGLSVLPTP